MTAGCGAGGHEQRRSRRVFARPLCHPWLSGCQRPGGERAAALQSGGRSYSHTGSGSIRLRSRHRDNQSASLWVNRSVYKARSPGRGDWPGLRFGWCMQHGAPAWGDRPGLRVENTLIHRNARRSGSVTPAQRRAYELAPVRSQPPRRATGAVSGAPAWPHSPGHCRTGCWPLIRWLPIAGVWQSGG